MVFITFMVDTTGGIAAMVTQYATRSTIIVSPMSRRVTAAEL